MPITQQSSEQMKLAMTRTNDLFNTEVFGKKNFAALDEIYTEDARILPPGSPMVSGRSAIKEFWANLIEATHATAAVLTSLEVIPTGESAVEIGKAALTVHLDGETESHIEVKYVVYWRADNDRMKWHIDIWNANA